MLLDSSKVNNHNIKQVRRWLMEFGHKAEKPDKTKLKPIVYIIMQSKDTAKKENAIWME